MAENTYTPSTEMVKVRYSIGRGGLSDDEEDVRAEAFDRWLAAHDAELLEREFDKAYQAIVLYGGDARTYFRARAAEIRKEQDR